MRIGWTWAMGKPHAVNSNPLIAFKAKYLTLASQGQANQSIQARRTPNRRQILRRMREFSLPIDKCSKKTTEVGVVTNIACVHSGDCESWREILKCSTVP